MKQTAVEWFFNELYSIRKTIPFEQQTDAILKAFEQAKEMERKQLFLAANTSAKQAYKAGQKSMYCGCYEIDGCTNYEEWLYNKTFKSE